jgi:hypothetical protein
MFLRKTRWIPACVLAVIACIAAPSRSYADTQIIIQEVDSSGNPIAGTTQIFASSTNVVTSLPNFAAITVTANSNSGAVSSLTSTVTAQPIASGFDPTIGLQVIVTSDGFTTPNTGGTGVVSNNAAASSGISGASNMLTSNTQLLTDPLTTPVSSTSSMATGSDLGIATGPASDTRPSTATSPTSYSTITGIPGTFAIQQVINVMAVDVSGSGIASGSTLGGSASSLVVTTAAPAPAGLLLGLAAFPVLGLRRVLRRKPVA